jgi:ribonuclease HI
MIKTAARIRTPNQDDPHRPTAYCQCRPCRTDKEQNCVNPDACAQEAKKRIEMIPPKLNPTHLGYHHGNLSLTRRRRDQNTLAKTTNDAILFDPTITSKENLAECFRIFTDPTKLSNEPARRHQDPRTYERHPLVQVFTDGACFNNGKKNARCGSGIWYGPDDERNQAIRVPGEAQSNQIGELTAVIKAISATPPFQPLEISTDSKYVINGLTTHLGTWEDRGWIGIKNAPFFQKATHLLRIRTAPTTFKWVKGHDSNEGNEGSDTLAKEGARKNEEDQIDLSIPAEFDVQGAKLITLTQAIAYRGIKETNKVPMRRTTMGNLQKTRIAIQEYTNTLETDESIWLSIRKPEIQTKIRQFLYKTMHGTQKIGKFWSSIPMLAHREHCQTCGMTETMEHILTKCREPPARIIWPLVE